MRPETFFTEHRIELVTGRAVAEIDRAAQGGRAHHQGADRLRPSRPRDRRAQPRAAAARRRARRRLLSAEPRRNRGFEAAPRRCRALRRHRRRLYRPRIRRDRPRQGQARAYRRAGRPGDGARRLPRHLGLFRRRTSRYRGRVQLWRASRAARRRGRQGHPCRAAGRAEPARRSGDYQHRRHAQRGARRRRRPQGRERGRGR